MKNYKNFILEKVNKKDLDNIYNKYYSDINRNIFNEIVKSDPTSLIDGKLYLGKYSKWLLILYKKGDIKLEDLYKVKDYIKLFDKESVRNKLPLEKRNINNYNSLSDLAKELDKFKDNEEILSKSEIKDKNFVKEFKNYNLFIPRTFKDSCILGKGTEWCTATEKTDKYYKKYHRPDRELLIFISKKDPKEKYQFHFRTKQFMDKFDEEIDIKEWLKENPDIDEWLKENIRDYKKINGDYDINLSYKNLSSLKNQNIPEIVISNFSCSANNLISLEGSPKKVKGNFYCSHNKLTTLEGGPEIVEGYFYCSHNKLISLKGGPKKVEGGFCCHNNKLNSLKYSPKIVEGNFDCSYNNLKNLIGAPEIVEGNFNCSNNNLTDKDIEWLKENCDIRGEIII